MTPVTDEVRYLRVVEEGSNRKRDLAGYRRVKELIEAQAREQAQASMGHVDVDVPGVWAEAVRRLRASVADSTFRLWLEPLEPCGVADDVLFLSAPDGIRAWAERRYSDLIAEALAASSCFNRVSFVEFSAAGGEG